MYWNLGKVYIKSIFNIYICCIFILIFVNICCKRVIVFKLFIKLYLSKVFLYQIILLGLSYWMVLLILFFWILFQFKKIMLKLCGRDLSVIVVETAVQRIQIWKCKFFLGLRVLQYGERLHLKYIQHLHLSYFLFWYF